MKTRKMICALLIALWLMSLGAQASVPSPSKAFYYLDQADVLSEDTKGEIFYSNQLLDEACGAQVVVVTVDSTDGESMSNYTYDLFNQWGIGDKNKNNGFLLVLAIEDENYYAVCGSNLQPKLTSSVLNQYFDDYLEADFAAGDYDAGVKKFFEVVFKRVADTYNANVTVADGIAAYESSETSESSWNAGRQTGGYSYRYSSDEGGGGLGILPVVVVLLIIALVVVGNRGRRRRTRVYTAAPPPPPMDTPIPGPGGYRGVDQGPMPGAGGYRGTPPQSRPSSGFTNEDWAVLGFLSGLSNSLGGGRSSRPSRPRPSSGFSSRPSSSSSHRSSSPSRSASGGGGHTSGGGAGRGRH